MVTTPPSTDWLYDDDPREEAEFLLGQVAPILGALAAGPPDDREADRLREASRRLAEAFGEAMFALVAKGVSVRLG